MHCSFSGEDSQLLFARADGAENIGCCEMIFFFFTFAYSFFLPGESGHVAFTNRRIKTVSFKVWAARPPRPQLLQLWTGGLSKSTTPSTTNKYGHAVGERHVGKMQSGQKATWGDDQHGSSEFVRRMQSAGEQQQWRHAPPLCLRTFLQTPYVSFLPLLPPKYEASVTSLLFRDKPA